MPKQAKLYRMVTFDHICPFGLKSLDLLEREGYQVDDHRLVSRAEADAFMAEQNVDTTPQTFIDGKRIGGYDDLRRFFGEQLPQKGATSYQPVIAVFSVTALMAMAASWASRGTIISVQTIEWFIAFSMCSGHP